MCVCVLLLGDEGSVCEWFGNVCASYKKKKKKSAIVHPQRERERGLTDIVPVVWPVR